MLMLVIDRDRHVSQISLIIWTPSAWDDIFYNNPTTSHHSSQTGAFHQIQKLQRSAQLYKIQQTDRIFKAEIFLPWKKRRILAFFPFSIFLPSLGKEKIIYKNRKILWMCQFVINTSPLVFSGCCLRESLCQVYRCTVCQCNYI